ncbi:MAG: glycosyl transferase [Sphingobacteriaceae bacterium]|nr:MAG: glycosyl transferase [Sphingobacteriaceae bacterium]
MKIAHLILAHNFPDQLKRLVKRLAHPDADVYIHLDLKTPIQQYESIEKLPNVYFVKKRIKVDWGSYNIVEATINGFQQIRQSGIKYDYINLLSGQDYPLTEPGKFLEFLGRNPGKAFMNSLVARTHWLEALPRVEQYHLTNFNVPGRYKIQRIINLMLPRRKMPNDMEMVGRSQWFAISTDCVEYILDYWEQHSQLQRFIKFTWAPDEFIFQTILYNSPLKDKMVNDNLRYIDWSAGGVSPKVLTMEDAEAITNSGKYFARKFSEMKDTAVMDYIDKHVLNEEARQGK